MKKLIMIQPVVLAGRTACRRKKPAGRKILDLNHKLGGRPKKQETCITIEVLLAVSH